VQFYVLNFLPVFADYYRFFHCPGKNTFCHGKNPTLPPTAVLAVSFLQCIVYQMGVPRCVRLCHGEMVQCNGHSKSGVGTTALNIFTLFQTMKSIDIEQ